MWHRAAEWLSCPVCKSELRLHAFDETRIDLADDVVAAARTRGIWGPDFDRYINSGVLLCERCKALFPITHGLPILVPYATPTQNEFISEFADRLAAFDAFAPPSVKPVEGEQFVMSSFSTEWIDYDYDGVIWDLSYADHERRFLAEIGPQAAEYGHGGLFVEIGCGLGLTSHFASRNLECDALGVDLSLAVLRASIEFKSNPFLHFVQGSAFYLPLRRSLASVVYTHGVLHHTYSTEKAVASVASHCADGGWFYVWLYGSGSKKGSLARRIAYWLEAATRPAIARNLDSPLSRSALAALACGYVLVNAYHRFRDGSVERYSFANALHAARDRFTPLFAHRHDHDEVTSWFNKLGFDDIESVDWRQMPTANQDNYRRNTGVRGRLPRVASPVGERHASAGTGAATLGRSPSFNSA